MSPTSGISDTIRNRRTIHQFLPGKKVNDEVILSALEHAVWAPNHHLTSPWNFYLLGPESVAAICRLNAGLVERVKGEKAAEIKLRRWQEIPGWLLLTCDRSNDAVRMEEDFAACCCLAQNMMLYLWEQGVGVKWTTGDVTREREFFRITGIDEAEEKVVGLFWYGYAAEVPVMERPPAAAKLRHLP